MSACGKLPMIGCVNMTRVSTVKKKLIGSRAER